MSKENNTIPEISAAAAAAAPMRVSGASSTPRVQLDIPVLSIDEFEAAPRAPARPAGKNPDGVSGASAIPAVR